MQLPDFIGGTFQSLALTAEQEWTCNWYVANMESPGATSRKALLPWPGVLSIGSYSGAGVGRGHYTVNGREFAVIGSAFVEIDQAGGVTSRGTVAEDGNPATIVANGDAGGQLLITSGANAYSYDLTTNTLAAVALLAGISTQGDMLDGYGLVLDTASSTLYVSDLIDVTTWSASQVARRSLAPDPWTAMKVLGRMVWLFGQSTSEVWYNVGAASSFPFAPYAGGLVIQYGCAAAFSPAKAGETLCWLAQDPAGGPCVMKMTGSSPERISTQAMEETISRYGTISDAVGDSWSYLGHTFYSLTFVAEGITWVYDLTSQTWIQVGTWISEDGEFESWRPRFHSWAFGQHRFLDSGSASVYQMTEESVLDVEDREIRRVRRAPILEYENERVCYPYFELDIEPGQGLVGEDEYGDNLITNYGFEVDLTGWTNSGPSSSVRTTTAAEVYEGVGALQLNGSLALYGARYTEVTVQPSTTYRVRVAMRGGGAANGAGTVSMRISCTDTGNYLTSTGEWDATATAALSHNIRVTTYEVYSITFTTEATAGTLRMEVKAFAPSASYRGNVDNVFIEQVTFDASAEPQVMLRWSNDAGRTWGPESQRSVGAIGEYSKRVRWNRCGQGRRRVFEVSTSDRFKPRITNAYIEVTGDAVEKAK